MSRNEKLERLSRVENWSPNFREQIVDRAECDGDIEVMADEGWEGYSLAEAWSRFFCDDRRLSDGFREWMWSEYRFAGGY